MTPRLYDRHVLGMCAYTAAQALAIVWELITP